MSFARWIEDWRWMLNMRRCRRRRRELLFSQRVAFDAALRPRVDSGDMVLDYPDAIYHIGIKDVFRAIEAGYSTKVKL